LYSDNPVGIVSRRRKWNQSAWAQQAGQITSTAIDNRKIQIALKYIF
jgi:hypothetical protein